jgi:hypothetical protein
MKESRNVVEVIRKLLTVIPEEETDLSNALEEYKKSLWNQAPEMLKDSYNWTPLQQILQTYITDLDTPWKEYVVKIFNDQEEELSTVLTPTQTRNYFSA